MTPSPLAITEVAPRPNRAVTWCGAGAEGCIICFASDDPKSLADLSKWKGKVEAQCGAIPMIIAQTKMDLMGDAGKTIVSACVPQHRG